MIDASHIVILSSSGLTSEEDVLITKLAATVWSRKDLVAGKVIGVYSYRDFLRIRDALIKYNFVAAKTPIGDEEDDTYEVSFFPSANIRAKGLHRAY